MKSLWLSRICSRYRKDLHRLSAAIVAGATLLVSLPAAAAGSDWKVVNMGTPINTEYQDGWATITGDGLTLYFSSNRPGGLSPANIEDGWAIGKDGTPTTTTSTSAIARHAHQSGASRSSCPRVSIVNTAITAPCSRKMGIGCFLPATARVAAAISISM